MPNVVCPNCSTTLGVTEEMLGGEVQCGQCQQIFRTTTVPKRATAKRDDEEDEAEDQRSTRRRSRRSEEAEDDDVRPSRRRSRRDDDDDDDRPSRRRSRSRRDDDDDDYDDRRREKDSNTPAVVSMILGIIAVTAEVPAMMLTAFGSLLCCGLGGFFTWPAHILGLGLGITGLILALQGMKKKAGKGMAIAGLATSIAALVLTVISVFLILAGYAAWQRALNNAPVFAPVPNNNNNNKFWR